MELTHQQAGFEDINQETVPWFRIRPVDSLQAVLVFEYSPKEGPTMALTLNRINLLRRMPDDLDDDDKEILLTLAERSVEAINNGDEDGAAEGAQLFSAAMRDNSGGLGTSPFESCGDHCQHHLDNGNAPAYATCYWACVVRGGPKTHKLPNDFRQKIERVSQTLMERRI